jgi:hypothetical protein
VREIAPLDATTLQYANRAIIGGVAGQGRGIRWQTVALRVQRLPASNCLFVFGNQGVFCGALAIGSGSTSGIGDGIPTEFAKSRILVRFWHTMVISAIAVV